MVSVTNDSPQRADAHSRMTDPSSRLTTDSASFPAEEGLQGVFSYMDELERRLRSKVGSVTACGVNRCTLQWAGDLTARRGEPFAPHMFPTDVLLSTGKVGFVYIISGIFRWVEGVLDAKAGWVNYLRSAEADICVLDPGTKTAISAREYTIRLSHGTVRSEGLGLIDYLLAAWGVLSLAIAIRSMGRAAVEAEEATIERGLTAGSRSEPGPVSGDFPIAGTGTVAESEATAGSARPGSRALENAALEDRAIAERLTGPPLKTSRVPSRRPVRESVRRGSSGAPKAKSRMPRKDGGWDGKEGDSDWVSFKVEVNRITASKPIPYRNGEPIFKEWAKERVVLTKMTGGKADATAARKGLQRQYPGRWDSDTHVEEWEQGLRGDNFGGQLKAPESWPPYTWHHEPDVETMSLVPRALNGNVPHLGGASMTRAGQLPSRATAPFDTNPL